MTVTTGAGRSTRLAAALGDLLHHAPELEAAAVVTFDGLPMASALPPAMDEDKVAAMSAALLSLGERAAAGLGRGDLSQVFVEATEGTVLLVSADDEAVLVAVARRGAKAGLLIFEARRTAAEIGAILRTEPASGASWSDVPSLAEHRGTPLYDVTEAAEHWVVTEPGLTLAPPPPQGWGSYDRTTDPATR